MTPENPGINVAREAEQTFRQGQVDSGQACRSFQNNTQCLLRAGHQGPHRFEEESELGLALKPFDPKHKTAGSTFTNGERALRAADAIAEYKHKMGENGPIGFEDAINLIGDTLHWLHGEEYGCASDVVLQAEVRFTAETNGDEEDGGSVISRGEDTTVQKEAE